MSRPTTVLRRYEPTVPSLKDKNLLGESILLPFSGRAAKSRIYKAATSEQMFSWDQLDPSKRGIPCDRLLRLYDIWSQGGYGIIITGNVTVDSAHLETPGNAILDKAYETKACIEEFRRIARTGKAQGSLVIMQLSHAGRRAPGYINPNPVSAGDVRLEDSAAAPYGKPTPLTREGIERVKRQFVYAAQTASQAGFDGIQLHATYDFLLAQFLSTVTNNRSDEYGGSFHNRSRIIREIVELMRAEIADPGFIIGIKIGRADFNGKIEEAVELCQDLEGLRVDFIELSGGVYENLDLEEDVGLSLQEFANQVSSSLTKTLVFLSGGFRSSSTMARAIRSGHCIGVGLGQPSASDPFLPSDILAGKLGGATKPDHEAIDVPLLRLAAGTHMEALARGDVVFDISNPTELREFNRRARDFERIRQEEVKRGKVEAGYMVWSPAGRC